MKKQSYLKKTFSEERFEAICLRILNSGILEKLAANKKIIISCCAALLALPILLHASASKLENISVIEEETPQLASVIAAGASSTKKGVITIPVGTVKANPFLPYRNLGDEVVKVSDVPEYNLVMPPETLEENSEAARIMQTIVSGILYDKYSPSAILNIEGKDYLVKKGDTVSGYKVVAITQDSVTVKLGSNVYKAGIGELLKEDALNKNDVSNLNNKFGGGR